MQLLAVDVTQSRVLSLDDKNITDVIVNDSEDKWRGDRSLPFW
jgi:hypothetical protein